MSEISNYIPISRTLFEHHLWGEERIYSRFEAWLDLLQAARFENTKIYLGNKVLEIGRGEILASFRYLAQRWGWSRCRVDGFLDLLIADKMITKRTDERTGQTIVILCNYDKYNPKSNLRETVQRTPLGHLQDTSRTKKNNDKKEKKDEEFDLSFLDKTIEAPFLDWLQYKQERKEEYRSQKSLEACHRRLLLLSDGQPDVARRIIDQSMANNWAGLFPFKKQKHEQTKSRGNIPTSPKRNEGSYDEQF